MSDLIYKPPVKKAIAVSQQDTLPPLRKFLTVTEAAAYTRRSYNWFYEHMAAGTLPFPWHSIDGKRVIPLDSLQAYIDSKEVKPGTPMPRRKREKKEEKKRGKKKEAPMKG